MFRQLSQMNCNCTFFPEYQTKKVPYFRSPQRHDPHKENKSKRSLKYHSSSRQKNLEKRSVVLEVAKRKAQSNTQNNLFEPQQSTITSKTQMLKHSHHQKKYQQNDQNNLRAISRNVNSPAISHLKETNSIILQRQVSTRAASPLNPCDYNSQRRVVFNYKNQYELRPTSNQIYAASPPPPLKNFHKKSQDSAATTLAGSYMLNQPVDARKRYQQQKANWSKNSFNQLQIPTPSQIQNFQLLRPSDSSENQLGDYLLRPRTSSNVYGLSRLSQMMNDREETQSIYEGEKINQEEGVQYSRVLISCRKLMEGKAGILEQSAQTKLFDFEQKGKPITIYKSGLFDKINIDKK